MFRGMLRLVDDAGLMRSPVLAPSLACISIFAVKICHAIWAIKIAELHAGLRGDALLASGQKRCRSSEISLDGSSARSCMGRCLSSALTENFLPS